MIKALASETPFARLVAGEIKESHFTLLDIGCSGGIDTAWRVFGDRLRALAFDPNLEEIRRLREQEVHPGVTYVPCFVGVPAETKGYTRLLERNYWGRNTWSRLSVLRTQEIRTLKRPEKDSQEKTTLNLWPDVPLADATKPVIIPSFLREHGVEDVDFIKIDVDGADFLILRSLVPVLSDAKVLGVAIEVNFFGTDDPDVHTFHNVDRLMKQCNFELFLLSTRPYSVAALPAPYQGIVPTQTTWGRIMQGDAIYFRDAAAPENAKWGESIGEDKLLKLAALFSLAGLPDCAAEVLLAFRSVLELKIDVKTGLDALTAQLPTEGGRPASYAAYMSEFEADSSYFYPRIPKADGSLEERLPTGTSTLRDGPKRPWTAPLRSLSRLLRGKPQ